MARPVNEERRKEKFDFILEAARRVFCGQGFLGVSMQDIIEACGISRGGLYLYFSSVEEIFLAVLSQRRRWRSDAILRSIDENTDFFELLDEYFIAQKSRLLHMEDSLLRATYEYLFTHKDSNAKELQEVLTEHTLGTINNILHLGVSQRAIRDDHTATMAEHLLYLIEGLSVLALTGTLTAEHIDRQFGLIRGQLLEQSNLYGVAKRTPLRVLVTAGDTSEQIDNLRKIVNPATGRLGSLTADMFALAGARVTYIGGIGTRWPTQPMEHIHNVEDMHQLSTLLETLLQEIPFDCVIHSMSVSEYTIRSVTTAEQLATDIAALAVQDKGKPLMDIALNVIRQAGDSYVGKRLPADIEGAVILMNPFPRIAARIRELCPNSILVGFKLLVDVTRDDLIRSANEMILQDNCDFILANDIEDISDTRHKAVLVAGDGAVQELDTKQEIAQAIVKSCLERYKQRTAEDPL